jgi:hypothetical protein
MKLSYRHYSCNPVNLKAPFFSSWQQSHCNSYLLQSIRLLNIPHFYFLIISMQSEVSLESLLLHAVNILAKGKNTEILAL